MCAFAITTIVTPVWEKRILIVVLNAIASKKKEHCFFITENWLHREYLSEFISSVFTTFNKINVINDHINVMHIDLVKWKFSLCFVLPRIAFTHVSIGMDEGKTIKLMVRVFMSMQMCLGTCTWMFVCVYKQTRPPILSTMRVR